MFDLTATLGGAAHNVLNVAQRDDKFPLNPEDVSAGAERSV